MDPVPAEMFVSHLTDLKYVLLSSATRAIDLGAEATEGIAIFWEMWMLSDLKDDGALFLKVDLHSRVVYKLSAYLLEK